MRRSAFTLLVILALAAASGTGSSAHAQLPQLIPSSFEVSASLTVGGDYGAEISSAGQGLVERAGTYEAAVSFGASVTISGVNPLTQSGSFQANGPFTATVSAPDVEPFAVVGTYTSAGTFTAATFTVSGEWVIGTPGAASGSFSGGGTYNLTALTAAVSGTYQGDVTDSERGPFAVQGSFGGSGSLTSGGMSLMYRDALQVSALADMIAQIAGLGASVPVAATALEMARLPDLPTPIPTPAPSSSSAPGAGTPTVAPAPPPSGFTVIQSGTSDIAALIAAQTFEVESVWKFDLGSQSFLVFVVGAPSFASSLKSLEPTDIVSLKSK